MEIRQVIEINRARQARAKELNTRAGEDVFHVLSKEDMKLFLLERMGSSRSFQEIQEPGALCLPALDEEVVEMVREMNPDKIALLGGDTDVEYMDCYCRPCTPQVKLSEEMVSANSWLHLPDEGIFLPGGRSVEVVVSFGYYTTIEDTNIPQFKVKVRKHLNLAQWNGWIKPEISLPDPELDGVKIPFIIESYGTCVVTGEKLLAYGTTPALMHGDAFRVEWYRSQEEAQLAADKAVEKLEELKAKATAAKKLEELKAQAESAREELKGLQSGNDWYGIDSDVRRKANDRTGYYSYLPSTAEEVIQWILETKAITAEVKKALTDCVRQREEAANAKANAERVEREELAGILAVTGDSLAMARKVKAFVLAIVEIKGAREGLLVLREELTAPYGRGRRQGAIDWKIAGISATDVGQHFLSLHRAGEVNAWLAGAIAWLETCETTTVAQSESSIFTSSVNKAKEATFIDQGKRHFSCSCGCSLRITKSEAKAYGRGEELQLHCNYCGGSGSVKKDTANEHMQESQAAEMSMADRLAALKGKFNR